jgi:hypothetical protein
MPDLRQPAKPVKVYYDVAQWLKDKYGGMENIPPESLGRVVDAKPEPLKVGYRAVPA